MRSTGTRPASGGNPGGAAAWTIADAQDDEISAP